MKKQLLLLFVVCSLLAACGGDEPTPTPPPPTNTPLPAATRTPRIPPTPADAGVLGARQPISDLATLPIFATRQAVISQTLTLTVPILSLAGDLTAEQQIAQQVALAAPAFQTDLRDPQTGATLRSEIFGIYPTRASDHVGAAAGCANTICYRVEEVLSCCHNQCRLLHRM